ncbi:hypothetical protein ES703_91955 [subsurface metagenome]
MAELAVIKVEGKRCLSNDGCQLFTLAGNGFIFSQYRLEPSWGYLVNMGIYFFYGAKLLDELGCCFLTDAGDAGDIIRGVTL